MTVYFGRIDIDRLRQEIKIRSEAGYIVTAVTMIREYPGGLLADWLIVYYAAEVFHASH